MVRLKIPVVWVAVAVAAVVLIPSGIALWDFHKQPQFCSAVCHIMEPYVATWTDSEFQVHVHAEEDAVCLDCHEATVKQQVQEAVAFVTGNFEEPLQRRQFPDEFCLGCHEHGSREEIIERTGDYAIEGELRNPHDPHPGIDESVVGQFQCSKCHTMHGESVGIRYCYRECHHEYTFTSCGGTDCH
jgi:hypothetical protein